MATKVITGKGRFNFPCVFRPDKNKNDNPDGKPKYSVTFIFSKKDKKTKKALEKAIQEAIEKGIEDLSEWKGKEPKKLTLPLHDGDVDRDEDENYANCLFFTARTTTKPGVVDADRDPIEDESELYSGCYGRLSVTLYPYATGGNKGIGVALNNVQKLEDGDPMGRVSRSSAEEDFSDEDEDEDERPKKKKKKKSRDDDDEDEDD